MLISTDNTPYHVIFSEALLGDKRWLMRLSRYQKIVILSDGLREGCIELAKKYAKGRQIFIVKQDTPNWQDELKEWLRR